MKKPRLYCKPGESYDSARARWLKRYTHYRDCLAMKECTGRNDFYKAWYGLKAVEVIL